MGCCACAGTCNHVGNHSYCAAHGGSGYYIPSVVTTTRMRPAACLGGHDYAVGDTHAICNRCEKVVPLQSDYPPQSDEPGNLDG